MTSDTAELLFSILSLNNIILDRLLLVQGGYLAPPTLSREQSKFKSRLIIVNDCSLAKYPYQANPVN